MSKNLLSGLSYFIFITILLLNINSLILISVHKKVIWWPMYKKWHSDYNNTKKISLRHVPPMEF